jgi:hypothetical protein
LLSIASVFGRPFCTPLYQPLHTSLRGRQLPELFIIQFIKIYGGQLEDEAISFSSGTVSMKKFLSGFHFLAGSGTQ